MKISVMGAGAFGLSFAHRLSTSSSNDVTVWTSSADKLKEYQTTGVIQSVLNGHNLPQNITMTMSVQEAAHGADLIFVLPAAAYVRDICQHLKSCLEPQTHVVVGSKGACPDGSFPAVVATEELGERVSAIAGPGFAIDIMENVPVGFTFATHTASAFEAAKQAFAHDDKFILDQSSDILGVELCSCIKNAAALACGALHGIGHPVSTQCLLMQRVLTDVTQMLQHIDGGSELTATSLAGVGDLILTCFSPKSRNSSFGRIVGQHGYSSPEAEDYLALNTVEGLTVVKRWDEMSAKLGVKSRFMNVAQQVFSPNGDMQQLRKYITE